MSARPRNRILSALFPSWTWDVHPALVIVSAVCALLVLALAVLVKSSPYVALDDSIDRFQHWVDGYREGYLGWTFFNAQRPA